MLLRSSRLPIWLLSCCWLLVVAQQSDHHAPVPPLVLPPLKRLPEHSFRRVEDDGRVQHWDISGHSTKLPTSNDFLRLVPPLPLAYGACYAHKPLPSSAKEWVVEVAFRLHGSPKRTVVVPGQDGSKVRTAGGRGLAVWITKNANPTFLTLPSDRGRSVTPPPPSLPHPNDPNDKLVSFFGSRSPFEGLGIIFDTAASLPVYARSEKLGYTPNELGQTVAGADAVGVISGVMDDGTGDWLETPEFRASTAGQALIEARYLEKSVGECEAAFRNAPGLVWARISHFNDQIRVDLDLTPHTTLSTATRVFSHHCFTIEGVRLPSGFHVGVTGIASGNPDPDSVDVYAVEAWEVLKGADEEKDEYRKQPDVIKGGHGHALAGTGGEDAQAAINFAHEVFNNQAKLLDSVEKLSKKVDMMWNRISTSPVERSPVIPSHDLASLEKRIADVVANPRAGGGDVNLINHVNQLHGEIIKLSAQVDSLLKGILGPMNAIQTRTNDLFNSLSKTTRQLDEDRTNRLRDEQDALSRAQQSGSTWRKIIIAFFSTFGVLGMLLAALRFVTQRNGRGSQRGKKLI